MFAHADIAAHYRSLTRSICELPHDPARKYSEFTILQRFVYVQRGLYQLRLPF